MSLTIKPACALDAQPDSQPMRVYSSKQGGYSLTIPSAWHVSEFPSDGRYRAALSREPVQATENYKYGVGIYRTHDYRAAFSIKSRTPEDAAGEFAQKLTRHESHLGPWELEPVPSSNHQAESWEFQMSMNKGTDACTFMWLVVSIKGDEWFHAAWSVPCAERQQRAPELAAMVGSLAVRRHWKVSK